MSPVWAFLSSASIDYLYLGAQLAASATGLWFALNLRTISGVAINCCAVVLCVTSCLTTPLVGPALIIWPVATLLVLASTPVRNYFGRLHPNFRSEV